MRSGLKHDSEATTWPKGQLGANLAVTGRCVGQSNTSGEILSAMEELVGPAGSYRLDALVATGRSGEVHRATTFDDQTVAIKLHDHPACASTEAQALVAVEHPGVVRLLDRGETASGQSWLALEWVEGRTLAHVLRTEGPLSLERSCRLVDQLAAAVDAAHDAGYMHGDLSPRNVMVDLDDRVVLVDFGSARQTHASGDPTMETAAIEVDTTPRYASPEVAAGEPAGPASDRYAVGLLAYEALTGAFPFPDVATPIAMLAHHASTEPIAASEQRPDLPRQLDDLFAAVLTKSPDDRPVRAMHLADALRATRSTRSHKRPRSSRALLASTAVVVMLVASALISLDAAGLFGNSDPEASLPLSITELEAPGPAGRAGGVACNLLSVPGFESGVPEDFYSGDQNNDVIAAATSGVAGSTALQIGRSGRYGIFGEMVPIGHLLGSGDEIFVFSAWVKVVEDPKQTSMYVDYLDSEFKQLTFRRDGVPVDVVGSEQGTRVVVQSVAPPNARYAVPTVFKDGSGGSMFVDEAVFAPINRCEQSP